MSTSSHKFIVGLVLVVSIGIVSVDSLSENSKKAFDKVFKSFPTFLQTLSKAIGNLVQEALAIMGLGSPPASGTQAKSEEGPATTAAPDTEERPAKTTAEPDTKDVEKRSTGDKPLSSATIERSLGRQISANATTTTNCIPWKVSGCQPGAGGANSSGCCDNGPNRPKLECQNSPNGRDAACVKQCLENGDECPLAMDNGGCCGSNDGFAQLRCLEDATMTEQTQQNFGRCGPVAEDVRTT